MLFTLLAAGALAPSLRGQERAPQSDAARPKLCFRGRPQPACDRFFITEIGVYHPVVRSQYTSESFGGTPITYPGVRRQATAQVGGMMNRGSRSAVGATMLLGFGPGAADFGVVGRYRRWLTSDGVAVDLSVGAIQGTIYGASRSNVTTYDARAHGITAEIALNAADYGALVVRTDLLRANGINNAALFGGARLGSRPAIAGSVVLAIGFSLLMIALSGSS